MEPRTDTQMRRAVVRALMELRGEVSEPMLPSVWIREVGGAMDLHLGPSTQGVHERFHCLQGVELELLADAVEERAAIVWFS